MEKTKILVVEDNERMRKVCVQLLRKSGYEVVAASNGDEALARVREQDFDVLLTDINMPGMSGDVLIDRVKELRPEILPVIMTAYPTMELAIESVGKGVSEFLTKPFRLEQLQSTIQRAIARRQTEVQRVQRQFAEKLLDMEQRLGGEFDLQELVETLVDPDPATRAVPEDETQKGLTECLVVLCEPIPRSRPLLQTSPNFRHFRLIYTAHQLLNEQLRKDNTPATVRLGIASRTADIPRFLRHPERVCGLIFGPNFSFLDDAAIRLLAVAMHGRVALCHQPDKLPLSRQQLAALRDDMGVKLLDAEIDDDPARSFWIDLFANQFRPFIARQLEMDRAHPAACVAPLKVEELDALISRDEVTVALANCLAKGLHPFPRRIGIPRDFRKKHLDPIARSEALDNPLPALFQKLVVAFERGKAGQPLSREERESGVYEQESVDRWVNAANEAVQQAGEAYIAGLRQQNPEVDDSVARSWRSTEELIALSLLLREPLANRIEQLLQATASIR